MARNMTFVMQTGYEHTCNCAWSVRSFLVSKYKILKSGEILRLCVADNFNIDEIGVDP
jgi:hypothetical protein